MEVRPRLPGRRAGRSSRRKVIQFRRAARIGDVGANEEQAMPGPPRSLKELFLEALAVSAGGAQGIRQRVSRPGGTPAGTRPRRLFSFPKYAFPKDRFS